MDTGSSDIWVESKHSELCRQPDLPCNITGTFDRNESSSYKRISGDFQISYVDGEYAQGDYAKDVFHFGHGLAGTSVLGVQFGIGLESTSTEGILGIGPERNEVQVQRLHKLPYPGLTRLMVDQGLIKSRAYSLWLNDLGILPTRPLQENKNKKIKIIVECLAYPESPQMQMKAKFCLAASILPSSRATSPLCLSIREPAPPKRGNS